MLPLLHALKSTDCSCSVVTDEGEQVINIQGLGLQDESLAPRFGFKQYNPSEPWEYAYNPCYAWSDGTANCDNVVVCQRSIVNHNDTFGLGDAAANWTDDGTHYYIEHSHTTRKTFIQLLCDPSATTPRLDYYSDQGNEYSVSCCCHLSSCWCAVYMKVVRGAEGVEVIPNRAMWTGLFVNIDLALEECQGVDDCSCKLSSNGKEINIGSLGYQGSQAPRFNYQSFDVWKYAYNPCYPWSDSSKCQNVAACQESSSNPDEKFPIGNASPATWTQENDAYVIKYSSVGGDGKTRTSVVRLACNINATEAALTVLGPKASDPATFDFTLTSKCCCPGGCSAPSTGGISGGSVLCIIVSVLILVYLVGGLLFMKFVRHAEGMEIIPNYDLWVELFGCIKDGFLFVFSCGKASGYDSV